MAQVVTRQDEIAALARQVRRVGGVYEDRALYFVPSTSDPERGYLVDLDTGPAGWCSCLAYKYSRTEHCKHLAAVRVALEQERAERIRERMRDAARRYGLW